MKPKNFFGLIAGLVMLAVAAFGQAPSGKPKLAIKEDNHNLGEVKKGVNASYTFVFKNEGTADLEIKRVAPT